MELKSTLSIAERRRATYKKLLREAINDMSNVEKNGIEYLTWLCAHTQNTKTQKKTTHTAREMHNMRQRQMCEHLAKHVKHVNVVFQRALLHETVHLVHVARLKMPNG